MGPSPLISKARAAIGRCLSDLTPGDLVLVACSGGADSLALASSAVYATATAGMACGLVTVDHQLQPGSAAQAQRVQQWALDKGLDPVIVLTVEVTGHNGPEASARDARYRSLNEVAEQIHPAAILLGHTQNDQAETVLLGLTRGSGLRAISGMRPVRGIYRRPLLTLTRAETAQICQLENLPVWNDPHNADDHYRRVRVRQLLSDVEEAIGPGVIAGLARTAALVQSDEQLLDQLADELAMQAIDGETVAIPVLAGAPASLRTRVLHQWACRISPHPGLVGLIHIGYLDALIMSWKGQGPVQLPGHVQVRRVKRRLLVDRI